MRNAIITIIPIFIAAEVSGQIVATRSSSPQFLIPAAGAQQGIGGTFFRSDVTIVNYRTADQRIRLQWLPQDVTGVGVPAIETSINASSGIASEDFVTNVMQKTDSGRSSSPPSTLPARSIPPRSSSPRRAS